MRFHFTPPPPPSPKKQIGQKDEICVCWWQGPAQLWCRRRRRGREQSRKWRAVLVLSSQSDFFCRPDVWDAGPHVLLLQRPWWVNQSQHSSLVNNDPLFWWSRWSNDVDVFFFQFMSLLLYSAWHLLLRCSVVSVQYWTNLGVALWGMTISLFKKTRTMDWCFNKRHVLY